MQRLLFIAFSVAVAAGAQTAAQAQNALTNKDVVTLAKAGFNEDFIVDTISMSWTHFDTSPDGLVGLAKEGLSERLIRVMMQPEAAPAAGEPAPASTAAGPVVPVMARAKTRTYLVKPSAVNQAISSQATYSNTTSILWGLWKKNVGVGSPPKAAPAATPLGGFFNQARMPQPAAGRSPAPPAYPYYEVATRYVVLQ